MALILSFLYLCLLYGLYVPDWVYQIQTEPSAEPKTFSVSVDIFCFFLIVCWFEVTLEYITSGIGLERDLCLYLYNC